MYLEGTIDILLIELERMFHNWGTDGKTELPFLCFEMYEICPEIIQVDFWLSYVLKY